MTEPKILTIDIETAPIVADVWSLWDQNVGLSQIHTPTRMICFAAKWHGNSRVQFFSEYHDGFETMVGAAYALLDDADVIVHFNGRRFDTPHLQREFFQQGLTPPAPFKQIDLLGVVKKQFKFPSNKLQYVSTALGLDGKASTGGHSLWNDCLRDGVDDDVRRRAWNKMARYNRQDVRLTEQLYDRLLPWINSHPHHGLYAGSDGVCANCGSDDVEKRGFTYTNLSTFQRYRCQSCGRWSRGKKALATVDLRGVAAA